MNQADTILWFSDETNLCVTECNSNSCVRVIFQHRLVRPMRLLAREGSFCLVLKSMVQIL